MFVCIYIYIYIVGLLGLNLKEQYHGFIALSFLSLFLAVCCGLGL